MPFVSSIDVDAPYARVIWKHSAKYDLVHIAVVDVHLASVHHYREASLSTNVPRPRVPPTSSDAHTSPTHNPSIAPVKLPASCDLVTVQGAFAVPGRSGTVAVVPSEDDAEVTLKVEGLAVFDAASQKQMVFSTPGVPYPPNGSPLNCSHQRSGLSLASGVE